MSANKRCQRRYSRRRLVNSDAALISTIASAHAPHTAISANRGSPGITRARATTAAVDAVAAMATLRLIVSLSAERTLGDTPVSADNSADRSKMKFIAAVDIGAVVRFVHG